MLIHQERVFQRWVRFAEGGVLFKVVVARCLLRSHLKQWRR
jgi:hypothetical protein